MGVACLCSSNRPASGNVQDYTNSSPEAGKQEGILQDNNNEH